MDSNEILTYLGIGISIGIPIGFISAIVFIKKDHHKRTAFAVIIALLWTLMHVAAFLLGGRRVDEVWNVVGALAVGDVIGIKVVAPVVEKVVNALGSLNKK